MILTVMREIKRLQHEKELDRLVQIGRRVLDNLPRYHPPRARERRDRRRREKRYDRKCERRRNSLYALKKSQKTVRSFYVKLVNCEGDQSCVNKMRVKITRALKLQRMLLIATCKVRNKDCKHDAKQEYLKQRANLTNELIRLKELPEKMSSKEEEIEARIE